MTFPDLTYNHGQFTKEVRDSKNNAPLNWAPGPIEILSTPNPDDMLMFGVGLSAAVTVGADNRAYLTFGSGVPRNKTYKVNLTCNGLPRSFRVKLNA